MKQVPPSVAYITSYISPGPGSGPGVEEVKRMPCPRKLMAGWCGYNCSANTNECANQPVEPKSWMQKHHKWLIKV